jgi:hypothetical protein
VFGIGQQIARLGRNIRNSEASKPDWQKQDLRRAAALMAEALAILDSHGSKIAAAHLQTALDVLGDPN